ncbi:MAG: uL22 family ribosomal protein [archaeon]
MDKQDIQQETMEANKELTETMEREHTEEIAEGKHEHTHENKTHKTDGNKENKTEKNAEMKTETKEKKKKVEIKAKESACVRGESLRISPKYAIAICRAIKRKTPEQAIEFLELVLLKKRAIKMTGKEVGHQRSSGVHGMEAGVFPKNASEAFIKLLRQILANALVNQVDNPFICVAIANNAPEPFRRNGTKGKRAHVYIEVRDQTKLPKNGKKIHKKKNGKKK